MYWQAPSLQTLKPSIERYLQQSLQLESLQLGELSWYWAGFLWLQADRLDFDNADHTLAYRDGSAAVRIPWLSLFGGEIVPDLIRLRGGALQLHADRSAAATLVSRLRLEGVDLAWRYGAWQGRFANLTLDLDRQHRRLKANTPTLEAAARLDDDGYIRHLSLRCRHTDWLPDAVSDYVRGDPQLNIELQRERGLNWDVALSLHSERPVTLMPESNYALQLNRIETAFKLSLQPGASLQPAAIDIRALRWQLGDNTIDASGRWQAGKLTLTARSQRLSMPLIWSWLRPLGDRDWQHWLSLMHAGVAGSATAELSLAWANPLAALPTAAAWDTMQYRLQAEVQDADIALGVSDDYLQHSHVQVALDQDGLNATVIDAELPQLLGHTAGRITVPWETLELQVEGDAHADVGKLLQWLGLSAIADWQWHQGRARGSYQLRWDISQAQPSQASARLYPEGNWRVSLHGVELQLSGGEVLWDQQRGLTMRNMRIKNDYLDATLSLQAAAAAEQWRITSLTAAARADLATMAARFQLPLAKAGGAVAATLAFDGHWSGTLDLKEASWSQLLGSSKQAGDALLLHYQGELDLSDDGPPVIRLNKLASQGNNLKLYEGSASISSRGLQAQLNGLHTPSFSGSLDIDVPFAADKPWRIDARARYLNRNALPAQLEHPEQMLDKGWLLRADIEQFDWDDARMSGVHVELASDSKSVGSFEASQIHTTQLDIMDVSARFTLPGQGRVELRNFAASLEKQRLNMSATLTPVAGGGMRWQGFAELSGDFGHMMQVGGLSERFLGGESHILFSGQGIMLREQPWWQGLDGRLRLRVDDGRILEGGTLTSLLAATNLSRLPALLLGQRKDLTGPGIMYERLQMEAIMQNQEIRIRNVAMRSAAFDLVGHGSMDIDKAMIDLYLIARPLQNLDALLSKIPLLRDLLGGAAHSLMRKVYHMHGPFTDAVVEEVSPEAAGLASKGLIEHLFSLPNSWFGVSGRSAPQR